MSRKRDPLQTGKKDLIFLPLGGAGEIGMNLNLLGHAGKWLMLDLGVTFGDDQTPGVDVIMPDPQFIASRREDLVGLVLTHAHEDHIGAVPYLWSRLKCPIFATPFTASVVRRKLKEVGLENVARITEVVAPCVQRLLHLIRRHPRIHRPQQRRHPRRDRRRV